jgi:hypothetical protein
MKLLSKLMLVSACCWGASAQAVSPTCRIVNGDVVCPLPPTPPVTPVMPNQGSTVAAIDANFPGIVIWSFQTYSSQMNTIVKSMLDRDLLLIATDFIANNGNQSELSALAATTLDATNLVRWQAAFTQAQVNPAVGAYSPSAISTAYFGHPALRVSIKGGGMPPALPLPAPTTSMTIQAIYYEFRLAPFATSLSAMGSTLKFLAGKAGLWGAATTGWQVGSWFYQTMESIDPSYGYDLVITYGSNSDSFGFFPPGNDTGGGQGYLENADGTYSDGYGNVLTALPGPTTYGVAAPPVDGVAQPQPEVPVYIFYDSSCLILGRCYL